MRNWWIFSEILVIIFLLNSIVVIYSLSLNISINEETEANQIIGNIIKNSQLTIKTTDLLYEFDNDFIRIKSDGNIVLKRKIDLENLCQSKKACCGVKICVISTNVMVSDKKEYFESVLLNLKINDINDNKPQFSNNRQILSIRESSPVNYSISLESAIDNDFSKTNRILNYKFEESTATFALDSRRLPQISLKLTKPLDYETKNQYNSILKACDKDACVSKEINIEIVDENDNKPVFSQRIYKTSLLEHTETGSLILTVHAEDLDSGIRGQIYYSISTMDTDLKQTFGIESRTGQIRLERRLAAQVRKLYSFDVLAEDGDRINPQKDKARVEITVVDINNYHPTITILNVNDKIEIRENQTPSLLCTLRVSDLDVGNNSLVHCKLDKESDGNFRLVTKSTNLYSLVSSRAFDYESEKLKSARITCTDQGVPPKTTDKNVLIYIQDVNEYVPNFKEPTYEVSVTENAPTNKFFLRIQATDRDEAAVIRYSIDQKGSKLFKIDSKTGWIKTTNAILDREKVETIIFSAYATDAVVDPFTATTKVIVTIDDENDNAPVFGLIPKFSILENQVSTRLKGKLTATDADKGINAKLEFVLWKTWARHQELHRIFLVTPNGYVETLQSLDRETFSQYILEVGVRDMGRYPLATSVNITVTVQDENDNQPQWLLPSSLDPIINITGSLRIGDVILTVRAFDPDEGENGRVRYKIDNMSPTTATDLIRQASSGPKPLEKSSKILNKPRFTVDSESGELRWLGKGPTSSNDMSDFPIKLTLIASDNGKPQPKFSILPVTIIYQPNADPYGNGMKDDPNNSKTQTPSATVIIVLIAATGFISIVLVVSIICVRKRPLAHPIPSSQLHQMHHYGNSNAKYSSCPGPAAFFMSKGYPYNITNNNNNHNNANNHNRHSNQAEWNFQDDICNTCEDPETASDVVINAANGSNNNLGLYQNSIFNNNTNSIHDSHRSFVTSPATLSSNNVRMRPIPDMHQLQTVTSSRTSYEPIDNEESGDSGKGPSEDIRNGSYLDPVFARNYSSLQWKIPSPIPSSSCNGRQLYTVTDQTQPPPPIQKSPLVNCPPTYLPPTNMMAIPSDAPPPPHNFSLPRSPDYYLTSNTNNSSNVQSLVYDSPDGFNSELELSQMQQSNI